MSRRRRTSALTRIGLVSQGEAKRWFPVNRVEPIVPDRLNTEYSLCYNRRETQTTGWNAANRLVHSEGWFFGRSLAEERKRRVKMSQKTAWTDFLTRVASRQPKAPFKSMKLIDYEQKLLISIPGDKT
jgi:hypothetical protein